MASVIRGNDNFDSATVGNTTAGAVGTYACLMTTSAIERVQGTTVAGSGLRWANTGDYSPLDAAGARDSAPSGTWQVMGNTGYVYTGSYVSGGTNPAYQTTIWLRIS